MIIRKILPIAAAGLLLLCAGAPAGAQYAPQAGLPGSTAIHRNSGQISAWANGCSLTLGLRDIAVPSSGYPTTGTNVSATGAADNDVVSLGDSGVAVLTFATPLQDAAGPDFAVFENGFVNPATSEEAYLELAFVEVSSDGANFFRFPAASATETNVQVAGAGQYQNARRIHNLAGKYAAPYGTPFDLAELAGKPGLNVQAITHVRIVDVIGSIGSHGSRDDSGRVINDPYPTPFLTGGFDLDAVAVLHGNGPNSVRDASAAIGLRIFPQPAAEAFSLHWDANHATVMDAAVADMTGRIVWEQGAVLPGSKIATGDWADGFYFLRLTDKYGKQWTEKVQVRR